MRALVARRGLERLQVHRESFIVQLGIRDPAECVFRLAIRERRKSLVGISDRRGDCSPALSYRLHILAGPCRKG
jgi:hypothetical protein